MNNKSYNGSWCIRKIFPNRMQVAITPWRPKKSYGLRNIKEKLRKPCRRCEEPQWENIFRAGLSGSTKDEITSSVLISHSLKVHRKWPTQSLEFIDAIWIKMDRINMSLLDAAHADSLDNIQLEATFKAFQDGTGKGGTGPSLQEKQNKATRDQICRD